MKVNRKGTPLIVTICSASKRCRGKTRVETLPRGSLQSVAQAWIASLRADHDLVPASDLYRGRAFALARQASQAIAADLGIISAGLGYVKGTTPVPSYDLTIRRYGPGSVVSRIREDFRPEDWWCSIARGPFATHFARDAAQRRLVLLCLSRGYASMIVNDLVKLATSTPLRIFGLSIEESLPAILRKFVLPYDERLAQIGLAGTRVDFPQRALWDYALHVFPRAAGRLEDERQIVEQRLARARPPRKRTQKRIDDNTIRALIPKLLPKVGANASRMLAHIRHHEGLSCEQTRFARIFREVRANAA